MRIVWSGSMRPERSDLRERVRLLSFVNNFIAGGTEKHVATLTRRLDPDVFEQHVACLARQGDFLAEFDARGIPLTEYPIAHLYGLSTVRQQLRLARELRSRRIQIVHTYGFYAHAFAIPAARLAGTPAIVAMVSRLNRARGIDFKGVGDFLEAAALVAKRHPDVRFVILGDGPCRAE